jgi:agmatine deiminase
MRLKAEWEKQNAIIMAFPHENTDWSEDLESAKAIFYKMAQAIGYSQLVYFLCKDAKEARDYFCSTTNIIFIECDFNDTWLRDYGPLSLEIDGKSALANFKFNGWGGKFEAALDNGVTSFLHSKGYFGASELKSFDYELEGGAIESDGCGTILTTKSCLLNKNRGAKSQSEVEDFLAKSLGAKRVLWVENSYLEGDDTDGHIDMLARFVDENTIAYLKCDDPQDSHYKSLQALEEELKSFRQANGKPYNLVALPFTEPKYSASGSRLPASYANFIITNKAVVVPTYQSPKDKEAVAIFKELFKDKEIIPLPSLKLIEQGGSLHCSSMQVSF